MECPTTGGRSRPEHGTEYLFRVQLANAVSAGDFADPTPEVTPTAGGGGGGGGVNAKVHRLTTHP